MTEALKEAYSVGALLYTPAINECIAGYLASERFGKRYSLAFCLEDTIADSSITKAEKQLLATLEKLSDERAEHDFFLPRMFIRVREPGQIKRFYKDSGFCSSLISGFICPKYSPSNADAYNEAVSDINSGTDRKVYIMPIIESTDIISPAKRYDVLSLIKEKTDSVRDYVLNIRVGGNDLSNFFAVRRHIDETIYDIRPVSQILGDIIAVFSGEYVVSGAVWEYFSSQSDEWKRGLIKELRLDLLNGFIGKTVIHPKQIEAVNEAMRIPKKDHDDALQILSMRENELQVTKSVSRERMNEIKTHTRWAEKTLALSEIYGVTE